MTATPTPIPALAPGERPEDDFPELDWDESGVDVAVVEPATTTPVDPVVTAPDVPVVVALDDSEVVVVGEDVDVASFYMLDYASNSIESMDLLPPWVSRMRHH